MHLLWVATKPPWPPHDGGRLALSLTLDALRAAGHRVSVIAPDLGAPPSGPDASTPPPTGGVDGDGCTLVRARPRPWATSLARGLVNGVPASIARHSLAAVRDAVDRALATAPIDLVVAEQLQALPQCAPAFARGVPVVLRAQNVESDIWHQDAAPGVLGWLLRLEGLRVKAFEALALARVAATLTLTTEDAARLAVIGPTGAYVEAIPAPFPAELPPGDAKLAGAPALVILAGARWRPNLDGARWFLEAVWPQLRVHQPEARVHIFGALTPVAGASVYPPPPDSRSAFAAGSIHVVPLRVATGVRMKVLEAWARGVPVIATSAAAAGLGARPGEELLLADDARGFTAALTRLRDDPGLTGRLVGGGRAALRARHDPARVAARWSEVLGRLVDARRR